MYIVHNLDLISQANLSRSPDEGYDNCSRANECEPKLLSSGAIACRRSFSELRTINDKLGSGTPELAKGN